MRRFDQQSGKVDVSVFGMHCRFTVQVLTALINAGHNINLVVLPRRNDTSVQVMLPPALKPRISMVAAGQSLTVLPNVAALAWSAGAALVETSHNHLDSLPRRFATLKNGLVISACFPWKLSESLLQTPKLGCLNIHPSLLPRHRGPDPLFWTFHAGDPQTGVTIHRMTSKLDAGPILRQREIPLPLHTRYRDADHQTVDLGAKLIVQVIQELTAETLAERHQPATDDAYESHPIESDLVAHTGWPAERGFRFVHGTGADYGPIAVELPHGDRLPVIDATSLHPERSLGAPMQRHGRLIAVQFSDGVVIFQPAPRQ